MPGCRDVATPRAWDIRPASADGSGGWLRIGHRAYAIVDVVGVSPRPVTETGVSAQLVVLGSMLLAGLLFAGPVTVTAVRPPLMFGGALFWVVATTGAAELVRRRPAALHRLLIRLRDGSTTSFASADPQDCAKLAAAIEARLATVGSRRG